ncbi:GNAT family N-acetyltransferase [Acidimangrovimonas sediminis]|uniref:GNAT family N-acetyltransferase n=1 Tax=Acidimangrovimonas sediminis TaxID=2056283 RepID=UPI000C7F9265|nr:GNAT family N-acetyltransferase [Acidimangrovimonas sediminis]
MEIPEIVTARLVLRGWRIEEFDRQAEIYADPEVTRFIGGPKPRSAAWDAFLRNAGTWALYGLGGWAVTDRAGGGVLGAVGFQIRQRGLGEDFDGAPECGWTLARAAQGRGIGTEAATAALRWLDARTEGARSHVVIDRDHVVSRRLAERLGYRFRREATYEGDPVVLMARERGGVPA